MLETSSFLSQTMWLLTQAAQMTIFVSAVGLAIGFVLAIFVLRACLSPRPALRRLGNLYTFVFRGIPLLVQLMLAYYLLPAIGIEVPSWAAAVLAISLCEGAYIGEILRGGFLGIPRGQIEAANMLGLSRFSILVRVEIPQAVRLTAPALLNEIILLIKASSLVSVVGVTEITRTAQNVAASSYRPLEAYAAAGLMYMVVCGALALLGHYAERRYREA